MRRFERGDGKISLIVMLLLLAAIIFVLVKWIPPRINAYEFKDFVESYARTESWNRTPDQMRKDLVEKAMSLDLKVEPSDITIEKKGANIRITVAFDVPVDFKVKTVLQHYEFSQQAEHY